MLFPSEEFLFAFLPIVIILYYLLIRRNVVYKNILLLLSSLAFYAYGEPKYVFLMILVIVINYLLGLLISRVDDTNIAIRRCILIVTVLFNVGTLGWFKYANFASTEISRVFGVQLEWAGNVVLPIGISFFTFQAMSYVFDVYMKRVDVEKNICNLALYVSFFPQLIAGPIVRFTTIAEQIKDRKESIELFTNGVLRFIKGFIKKVLIANNMAIVADAAWELIIGGRFEGSIAMAWLGAISYTLQILFDFSGYSDMAIGLGKMFGFEFLENFDHPYIAGSVTEFWRRWHISLSAWFRDYVYIPLGGSRKGLGRTILNLFVVWLLTGIWHGANWTFLLWGLIYFVVLTVEKIVGIGKEKKTIWGHLYTLIIVIIAWVVFRSDSISDAFVYLGGMFGRGSGRIIDTAVMAYLKQNVIYYVFAVLGCMPIMSMLEKKLAEENRFKAVANILYAFIMIAAFAVAITFVINNAYNPFIYFNF